jgi:NADH-quinone oxidoreductase subunit J
MCLSSRAPGGTLERDRVSIGAYAVNEFLIPILLYGACAAGAVGIALALPRRKPAMALVGGLVAASGAGLMALVLLLAVGDSGNLPNIFFYIFGLLALGSGLRVVTHPRPVYSALYFILTVIASAGLFVLLGAEFMAFALIIIYAGAILITYLFVIMLATQAPAEGDEDKIPDYDAVAREPIWASAVGFVLLATLTTVFFYGTESLPGPKPWNDAPVLAAMPQRIERELRSQDIISKDATIETVDGVAVVDAATGEVMTSEGPRELPESLDVSNIELLGFNLLRDNPMTIEIAGVILLMAMLGATVLARRQVDLDDEAKARQARHLHLEPEDEDA